MTEAQDKDPPHHGHGRTTGGSSSASARGAARDKGRRDQMIQENLERVGCTIPPGACPDTPHLKEFDKAYITKYPEEVIVRRLVDTRAHLVLNYVGKQKMVEESCENNPYEQPKDLGVDYRFWNEFHFNFYASVIFNSKKNKIVKMQYVDQEEMKEKNEPEFNRVIRACENFGLSNLMSFRYNWNEEVLAQFHATFFYDIYTNEIHWMTERRHYRVDFMTFSQILSFGEEERGFTYIHDEPRIEIRDIAYTWIDRRSANGKVSGLQSYCYILNNLIRHTINPKDGATLDLNGHVRNVLARFSPRGDRFNVPRFMWCELRIAMDDGRKGLPYAPYLMFLIERVIGYKFDKDGCRYL